MACPDLKVGGPDLPQIRRVVTEIPGPKSLALQVRRSAVAAGVGTVLPVYVAAAGGGVIVDVDDNSLIDFGSGIAVTSVGNAAPRVVRAVQDQAAAFTHTCFMLTPYESYIAVAEKLNSITPGAHAKRTVLFNSGAEAVENAIKIARTYTRRQAVVVFDHAYHGRTNLTMAMTAKSHPYKSGFGPFAGEVYRAPMSYPFRDGNLSGREAADRAIDRIEKQVGSENVAAVVIEPIQGEGGFVVPAPGFLPSVASWCQQRGIVFVADEVQTGIGRTGDMFASEHEGIVPDLVATAKGLAGGLPLSAVTGRAEVMDSVHVGGLGGTYGGNPLACAAALAVFESIERDRLLDRAQQIGRQLVGWLSRLKSADDRIGDVRGRGAMVAIELIDPVSSRPDAAFTSRIAALAHSAGLLILTCGSDGNVLRLLPPLSISDELLDEGLDVLARAFEDTL